MATAADTEIAETLTDILRPYEDRLDVVGGGAGGYYVQTRKPYQRKTPLMFGGVRAGKAYVSFHLVPLYMYEELKATLSPALRKRMQGKACFNFKAMPEPALLEELRALTAAGFRKFVTMGFV